MSFRDFIKDKIWQILLIIFILMTIEIFLLAYSYGIFIKIYIPVAILSCYFIAILIEYIRKKIYYENIYNLLNKLEEKYLITELIQSPNFSEGGILREILKQVDKSMLENVNKYRYLQEDYKEYIEMWIHEIKIPIATSKMIIANNKNEITKSIDEELDKVEDYVEQALYYARSNTVDKDYYIKKSKLKDIVNECIKKNKSVLINEKISINLYDLDLCVNTDSKWIIFILNQIIQNSIKYRKKEGEITRVFEKGFTGTNGRISNKKSTGIGLYLCKKLCDKLGIAIELNSVQDKGTEVKLIFPNSSYTDMK